MAMSTVGSQEVVNRRSVRRAPVEITSMIRVDDQKLCGILIDLSEKGMAVRSPGGLVSGATVEVWFSLPYTERTFQCEGKVVWSDGIGRAGLRFVNLSDETTLELRQWLSKYAATQEES